MVVQYQHQEKLSRDDDFLSDILLDNLGQPEGERLGVHKSDSSYVPAQADPKQIMHLVRKYLLIPSPYGKLRDFPLVDPRVKECVKHLLEQPVVRRYLLGKKEVDRARFKMHAEHYLTMYLPHNPFEIGKTDRYTVITGKNELAVYALAIVPKGTLLVPFIRGSLAPLTMEGTDLLAGVDSNLYSDEEEGDEEEEEGEGIEGDEIEKDGKDGEKGESEDGDAGSQGKGKEREKDAAEDEEDGEGRSVPPPRRKNPKPVGRAMRDFSVIYSMSRRRNELFLGPARFLNHDCNPNCKLKRSGRNLMSFETIREIQPGEELTALYGDDYFGPANKECLCATCESRQQGYFSLPSRSASLNPSEASSFNPSYPSKQPSPSPSTNSDFLAPPLAIVSRSSSRHRSPLSESNRSTDTLASTLDGPIRSNSCDEQHETGGSGNGEKRISSRMKEKERGKASQVMAALSLSATKARCETCQAITESVDKGRRMGESCPRCIRHQLIFTRPWPSRRPLISASPRRETVPHPNNPPLVAESDSEPGFLSPSPSSIASSSSSGSSSSSDSESSSSSARRKEKERSRQSERQKGKEPKLSWEEKHQAREKRQLERKERMNRRAALLEEQESGYIIHETRTEGLELLHTVINGLTLSRSKDQMRPLANLTAILKLAGYRKGSRHLQSALYDDPWLSSHVDDGPKRFQGVWVPLPYAMMIARENDLETLLARFFLSSPILGHTGVPSHLRTNAITTTASPSSSNPHPPKRARIRTTTNGTTSSNLTTLPSSSRPHSPSSAPTHLWSAEDDEDSSDEFVDPELPPAVGLDEKLVPVTKPPSSDDEGGGGGKRSEAKGKKRESGTRKKKQELPSRRVFKPVGWNETPAVPRRVTYCNRLFYQIDVLHMDGRPIAILRDSYSRWISLSPILTLANLSIRARCKVYAFLNPQHKCFYSAGDEVEELPVWHGIWAKQSEVKKLAERFGVDHLFSNLLNLTNPELDELIHEAEEEEFRDPNRDPTPNYDMQDHAEDEEADRDEEAEMGDEPNPIEVEAEEGSTQEKEAAAGADGGVRGTVGNYDWLMEDQDVEADDEDEDEEEDIQMAPVPIIDISDDDDDDDDEINIDDDLNRLSGLDLRSSISPKRRIKVKREEMIDLSSDPVLATARNTGKKQNVVEIN